MPAGISRRHSLSGHQGNDPARTPGHHRGIVTYYPAAARPYPGQIFFGVCLEFIYAELGDLLPVLAGAQSFCHAFE